jgi:hypothetical protein
VHAMATTTQGGWGVTRGAKEREMGVECGAPTLEKAATAGEGEAAGKQHDGCASDGRMRW